MKHHDDMVDAFRYFALGTKWQKWFDKQPWYYKIWYRIKQWFKRKLL